MPTRWPGIWRRRSRAGRLIIAGATAGVLDWQGATIARLTPEAIADMMASGTAHSGMIAKLAACRRALDGGVTDISIVSGRGRDGFRDRHGHENRAGHDAGRRWNGYDDSHRRHRH